MDKKNMGNIFQKRGGGTRASPRRFWNFGLTRNKLFNLFGHIQFAQVWHSQHLIVRLHLYCFEKKGYRPICVKCVLGVKMDFSWRNE